MTQPATTGAAVPQPVTSAKTPGARSRSVAIPALVAAVALGAFALRLVQLGVDSLWYDESVSVYLAGQPAAELIAHTARDIHPPGYYLLLRAWLVFAGFPTGHADASGFRLEFMAGFLSLCLGVLLVPLTWQLARRLRLGDTVAALAALLVAVSPFGVWYSQEVRMYTLGACLAVVCLLATVPFLRGGSSQRKLIRASIVFALAAAAGLFTLYYFAFLLVSVNLLVLLVLATRLRKGKLAQSALSTGADTSRSGASLSENSKTELGLWLAAQIGAVILYLPWLPVAWRQATDPPVPPWRTAPQLGQVLVESWNALSFGQSADVTRFWPLLLLTLALVAVGVIVSWRKNGQQRLAAVFLLVATFGPLALILLASVLTPLYHVRYLFTYSPPFSILLALGMTTLARWRRPAGQWLAAGAALALLAGCALSLRAFWTDPVYAADDLRSATRELAQRWRPGDAILANAGYTYPALLTYWPGPLAWHGRLSDYTQDAAAEANSSRGAIILQTGHVDGDADLGWADPRSDFYALPAGVMQEKLAEVAKSFPRLWHFRLYDTVNDPQGLIREDLAQNWTLFDDRVYRGEANLRVQGWQAAQQPPATTLNAEYANRLVLRIPADAVPATVVQGDSLDLPGIVWSLQQDNNGRPLAASLRLVDDQGEVWASIDEPIGGNAQSDQPVRSIFQPMRLEIPEGTPPGSYRLELVVYDPATGLPLAATGGPLVAGTQAVLGTVVVQRPANPPTVDSVQADFGPLRLVEAAHLPQPSAQETRFRCRCSGRPRRIINRSRWSSSCSY